MDKISVKKLIEFRSKTARGKSNFVKSLKVHKPKVPPGNGGDYWTIVVSAISKAFKEKDHRVIKEKIREIEMKLEEAKIPIIKAMYTRNLEILGKYRTFDFAKWWPIGKNDLLKNSRVILPIKEIPIEAVPHHVFRFGKVDFDEVGALWIVAKKEGFKKDEVGVFTEMLHRYLKSQYGKKYKLNPRYCMAIDIVNNQTVNYSQIEKGEVASLLVKTIDEIKMLL